MRRTLLSAFTGLLTGILALGVAWATTGLVPVDEQKATGGALVQPTPTPSASPTTASPETQQASFTPGDRLPGGMFLAGAHNESIAPIPVSEGGQWNAHGNGYDCGPIGYEYLPDADPSCLRTFDRVWATGVDRGFGSGHLCTSDCPL